MNHSVFLTSGVESPNGAESPQHLETLTSSSGPSFQPLSSYPPTTTYYTTPATYFTSELPTHHGLQPVRLPSISSSLSGVGDLTTSIIKEHPAAVQADQMNSYMEYFVDQSDPSRSDEVVEEVVVDDHHIMDDEDESRLLEDDGIIEGKFSYTIHEPHSSRSQPSYKRKKQLEQEHELDELLRQSNDLQTPEIQITLGGRNRVEATRQRRAEAARSRYQRMSESERKAYNQKRRLKALGIDPSGVMSQDDQTAMTIKETIKLANAKKAEAARLRYHRMTPEEKRDYNQRRTESFRKRREEEEILLSTPAGCISAESLKKAQQIMIRNARKAESARLRYQRMTPDQRKSLQDYNVRRAQSKRGRKSNGEEGAELDMSCSGSSVANDSLSDQASFGLGTSFNSEPSFEPDRDEPPPPPPVPKDPTEEIFQQMEKEVMKKTKQAKAILDKQRTGQELPAPVTRYPEPTIQQDLLQEGGERAYVQNTNPLMIDEKALHDMLVTGRDANGLAVELRTIDGHKITQEAELNQLAQGQTIVIAPVDTIANDTKDSLYVQTADGQIHLASSSGQVHDSYGTPRYRGEYVVQEQDANMMSLSQKHEMAKAKRAERARIRYRNMQPELRQAQNARRADLLRKSRARDEELVTMAETRDVGALSNDLQRAIHDAQERRRKRAEQARQKYHRMSSEERRQYNAMRDAQRRQRKRQQEMGKGERGLSGTPDPADLSHEMQPSGSNSISPSQEPLEENIIYNEYDIYDDPGTWEQ